MTRKLMAILFVGALVGLSAAVPATAYAAPKKDNESSEQGKGNAGGEDKDGDADSDSGTAHDEDSDGNDGTANNIPDDGDNAHPSGKDRSVEHGKSNNQGKAESNPDDTNGPKRYEGEPGDDKPNGPGGNDLADQDGNNGCGNDDDFDDDNNGHCGRRSDPSDDDDGDDDDGDDDGDDDDDRDDDVGGDGVDDDVLDRRIVRDARTDPDAPLARRATRAATLPFTGGDLVAFVSAGLGLVGAGGALHLLRSRKSR